MGRSLRVVSVLLISVLASALLAYVIGLRLNATRSIPLGVYITSSAPIAVGRYVIFCPSDRGDFQEAQRRGYIGVGLCPGGLGQLMKRVLAEAGDYVHIDDLGVHVNGVLLIDSKRVGVDARGKAIPGRAWSARVLAPSEVLLMSDANPDGYDGRYYGPVDRSQIKSVIRPIMIWSATS